MSSKETSSSAKQVSPFGAGSPRRLPMKVIVCGLGRTGTASMKTALEILGFPTYHAFNLWADSEEHIRGWNRAIDAKYGGKEGAEFGRYDWDEILGDYSAVVDAPSAFWAAELAEIYPDAKVVVLNRDPDAWFRSCQAAFTHRPTSAIVFVLFRLLLFWSPQQLALGEHMNRKQLEIWQFEWHDASAREKALAFFEKYYADCRARIPAHRRLEFAVQDGWEPLCKHLGVDVPTAQRTSGGSDDDAAATPLPFPRTNEAAEFKARVGAMRARIIRAALWRWAEVLVMAAALGYGAYRVGGPWLSPWRRW